MPVSTSNTPLNTTSAGGTLAALAPWTHTLLRVGAGLLFMQHGLQKLFGWFGGMDGSGSTVTLMSQMGLAGVLETFGGLLLVLGLFTRPVAFLVAGEMLVAFLQAHLPRGGVPLQNGGEVPLLFMLVFLFLLGHGAGRTSLDQRRQGP
ncbi:MAG: DoxX family protein [Gemmatimonadales bacterium]